MGFLPVSGSSDRLNSRAVPPQPDRSPGSPRGRHLTLGARRAAACDPSQAFKKSACGWFSQTRMPGSGSCPWRCRRAMVIGGSRAGSFPGRVFPSNAAHPVLLSRMRLAEYREMHSSYRSNAIRTTHTRIPGKGGLLGSSEWKRRGMLPGTPEISVTIIFGKFSAFFQNNIRTKVPDRHQFRQHRSRLL